MIISDFIVFLHIQVVFHCFILLYYQLQMKKNTAYIKVLNHNNNQLEKPASKRNNKSPSLSKSRSSDHFCKFSKPSCKKQKNDRQKAHVGFQTNNKECKQEYKLEQIYRSGNIEKNKNIYKGRMNLKEKQITNSKKQTTSTSKNKNQYDLKQKKKNKPSLTKKFRKQQPEPAQINKQQLLIKQRKSQNQIKLTNKQLEYQLLTPQPTSKHLVLDLKEKIRNLSNKSWGRKSEKSCQLSQSEILTQPRLVRYEKFAFRSQKYIKLNQQLKQKQSKDKKKTPQQAQKQQRPKYKSAFKRRVSKLNRQIEYYRQMSSKSQKVLKTIQNIHKKQQKQFKLKKQAYIQQIQRLKQNLEEYKPHLGHIYTYKQLITQSLVPDSIIIEGNDQNESIVKSKIQRQMEIERKGNKLIQYYINYQENTLEQNQHEVRQSEPSELCLSVTSKQEN